MRVIDTKHQEAAKFSLYFLAFDGPGAAHHGVARSHREGILELTHNYGTESDPNFHYHNGNDKPQGFGHICFSVNDIEAACADLEAQDVKFRKRLVDGRQKGM